MDKIMGKLMGLNKNSIYFAIPACNIEYFCSTPLLKK